MDVQNTKRHKLHGGIWMRGYLKKKVKGVNIDLNWCNAILNMPAAKARPKRVAVDSK